MFDLMLSADSEGGWKETSTLSESEWAEYQSRFADVFTGPVHFVRLATSIAVLRTYGFFPDPMVRVYLPRAKAHFMRCLFEESKLVDREYPTTKDLIEDIGGTTEDLENALRATIDTENQELYTLI